MEEVFVPKVGESVTEVVLGEWKKADGAYVKEDEVICELESDKANFELNAPVSGALSHAAAQGDTLKIGALVCRIDIKAVSKEDSISKEEVSFFLQRRKFHRRRRLLLLQRLFLRKIRFLKRKILPRRKFLRRYLLRAQNS